MPLWAGVLVAAASAYLMLFLERLGVRYLEVLFELLIAGGVIGQQLCTSICCSFCAVPGASGRAIPGVLFELLIAGAACNIAVWSTWQ